MKSQEQLDIERIIEISTQLFNDAVGKLYFSKENLEIAFFTPENGVTVYEKFCSDYFPRYLAENYNAPGYMQSFLAQAFWGEDIYGILVRLCSGEPVELWPAVILHELSHIFCSKEECADKSFFDLFCNDDSDAGGPFTIVGYAVWREFIADYLAAHFYDYLSLGTKELRETVHSFDVSISYENPDAKLNMSKLLAYLFWNRDVKEAENSEKVIEYLTENLIFSAKMQTDQYYQIISHINNQLAKTEYWKISVEFIDDLGEMYLMLIGKKVESALR